MGKLRTLQKQVPQLQSALADRNKTIEEGKQKLKDAQELLGKTQIELAETKDKLQVAVSEAAFLRKAPPS